MGATSGVVVTAESDAPRRCFIAIEIPADTKRRLNDLTAQLRAVGVRASWVRGDNVHLTLRFLGNISPAECSAVESELAATCERISPFHLTASGCGAFPNARRPRVLWAGVEGAVDELIALAGEVETAVQHAGLERVRSTYKPHITLGRIRSQAAITNLESVLRECAGFDGGAIPVDRVSLFASELRRGGARHTVLQSFELGIRG